MILIGIGSNLAASGFDSPRATAAAAVRRLAERGIRIARLSSWYMSEPVPRSDQPWYVNALAVVATVLSPNDLLDLLLDTETEFGRERSVPNAARTLDLDLLDYDGRACATARLILPHPRLHERRFVLAPVAEVAPEWRHRQLGLTAAELLARLPPGQELRVLGGNSSE